MHSIAELFFSPLKNVATLAYVLVAVAIGFALGRYRVYRLQNRGEALFMRSLKNHFKGPDYHLMNNVTLRLNDGSTQVDHILVSKFGVFVIETKDYKGWIFASSEQAKWTQVIFKQKFRFQNPIRQNFRHVRAVQDSLDFLSLSAIRSAVVFTGDAEFKTDVPEGVFSVEGFIEYLQAQTEEIISLNRVQFCVGRLESERLALTRQTDIEHVRALQRRHGNHNYE